MRNFVAFVARLCFSIFLWLLSARGSFLYFFNRHSSIAALNHQPSSQSPSHISFFSLLNALHSLRVLISASSYHHLARTLLNEIVFAWPPKFEHICALCASMLVRVEKLCLQQTRSCSCKSKSVVELSWEQSLTMIAFRRVNVANKSCHQTTTSRAHPSCLLSECMRTHVLTMLETTPVEINICKYTASIKNVSTFSYSFRI